MYGKPEGLVSCCKDSSFPLKLQERWKILASVLKNLATALKICSLTLTCQGEPIWSGNMCITLQMHWKNLQLCWKYVANPWLSRWTNLICLLVYFWTLVNHVRNYVNMCSCKKKDRCHLIMNHAWTPSSCNWSMFEQYTCKCTASADVSAWYFCESNGKLMGSGQPNARMY
jgi:hypothetical protein